jgi:hypothetical protein
VTEPARSCVCCTRPMTDPGYACLNCETRIDRTLADIPDLYALLPAVLAPQQTVGPKVSGSRERPIPINVDVHDLVAPARNGHLTEQARHNLADHGDGQAAIAATLDSWVQDWRDTRNKGEGRPAPYVPNLVAWLRPRLQWACRYHPAVDEFAREMTAITGQMRRHLRLARYTQRLAAPCPSCDLVALHRQVDPVTGADDWISCGGCGRMWSEQEYARLAVVLIAETEQQNVS